MQQCYTDVRYVLVESKFQRASKALKSATKHIITPLHIYDAHATMQRCYGRCIYFIHDHI